MNRINFDKLYAHINFEDKNKKQSFYLHSINTANEAKKIGDKIGIGCISFLVGLLHDTGKIRESFQVKLKENSNAHVDHSSLGGAFILKMLKELNASYDKGDCGWKDIIDILKENKNEMFEIQDYTNILMYSIMSHHGQFDLVRKNNKNEYVYATFDRINKIKNEKDIDVDLMYEEVRSFWESKGIFIRELYKKGFKEYLRIIKELRNISKHTNKDNTDDKNNKEAMLFYKSMLIRLIVSILKSADIKDSINAYGEIIKNFNEEKLNAVICKFEQNVNVKYENFVKPKKKIDVVRNKISKDILKRSKEDKTGIYKLDLPTGAGKTLLSLRYGINQMKYQEKERFFYVTSFLSVLEQNASQMKEILNNDDYILEHHSNIINEDSDKGNDDDSTEGIRRKFLIDDWTSPVVLTTTVQFYNSIFKGRASNLTRFKSLINSVIILDEWQTVPINFLYITNLFCNFLKVVMNATIVLSTATQPTNNQNVLRHKLFYGDLNGKNEDIVTLTTEEEKVFERVKLKVYGDVAKTYNLEDITRLVIKNKGKSNLIILNTKKVVKSLYGLLQHEYDNEDLYYLTTNLTAAHRLKIIKEIKEKLKKKHKICVVSTQLIEAGVDVDFDVVIRSFTGMDSIVQAMGRCNREGERAISYTYLIKLDSNLEKKSMLKGMHERESATNYVIKNFFEYKYDLKKLIKEYFKKLYANLDNSNFSEVLELLSKNSSKGDMFKKPQNRSKEGLYLNLFQSFKESCDKFELIEQKQKTAIVDYDETREVLNEIRDLEQEFLKTYEVGIVLKMKKLIRKLSRHTVPINDKDINSCENILDGEIYILPKQNYNDKFGIIFDEPSLYKY